MSKNPNEHLCKLANFRKLARKGYGMALLMTFLTSSILIGTSTAILLAPSLSNAVGSLALDEATARQLAEEAIDAAKADILTQQQAGTTIDTSYRYPSVGTNTISVPTYPGSASSTAKGTYYVTATYARGFSFLLKATVTVGANTFSLSRLVQLYNPPSLIEDAYAIYALRKVNPDYTGSAVRVRCATNPSGATTQDIGFDGSGNFDIAGLRTCLGDSTLPLDVTTGEKLAYGLRKLSSSYNGYAIKVRRSSDNTTQDIGFDANGNLDTVALKSFVGSGSGYIRTWYDQAGSSKDATQTTNADQPRIMNAGVLETSNNIPSVYFDGTNYLQNTTLAGTHITGTNITTFIVTREASTGGFYEIVNLHKNTGEGYTYQSSGAADMFYIFSDGDISMDIYSQVAYGTLPSPPTTLFQATTFYNGSVLRLYGLGSLLASTTASPPSLSPTIVYLGVDGYNAGPSTGYNFVGHLSEVIIFNSALSATNRTAIERSQGHYYNITGMQDGYVTTWYDQSGNNRNLTQTTTTLQPTINQSTPKAGVYFDGTQYIDIATLSLTTDRLTLLSAANISPENAGSNGRAISVAKTGDGNDWGTTTSSGLLLKLGSKLSNVRNGDLSISTDITYGVDFTATVLFNGSFRLIRQQQGGLASATTATSGTGNLVINKLRVGQSATGTAGHEFWKGNIYESILFSTNLSASDYQTLESEEQTYYGIQ